MVDPADPPTIDMVLRVDGTTTREDSMRHYSRFTPSKRDLFFLSVGFGGPGSSPWGCYRTPYVHALSLPLIVVGWVHLDWK